MIPCTRSGHAFYCTTTNKTAQPRLLLSGGINRTDGAEPRGTINAVFEYLRLLGFRFYTPYSFDRHGQMVHPPPATMLACPTSRDGTAVYRPSFDYRVIVSVGVTAPATCCCVLVGCQPHERGR